MRNIYLISLLILFLACQHQAEKEKESTLPILDLTKEYPKRLIDIHEIADVEYIPLETTKKSALALPHSFRISEKYIFIADILMSDAYIQIFNRQGKHLSNQNNRGQGPKDYYYIRTFAVDFEKEEYYIDDRVKIQVYDFEGKWKRTYKLPEGMIYGSLFDYNEQYLIGNNMFHDYFTPKHIPEDKHPYYLINKENWQHLPLDIHVEKKVSRIFDKGLQHLAKRGTSPDVKSMHFIEPFLANSHDILIADFGQDTLYRFKDNKLEPIAVQYPPVHNDKDEIPTIVGTLAYSDQYLFFKPVVMKYIPEDINKPYYDVPLLMWDRNTNEIFNVQLFDSNRPNAKKRSFVPMGDIVFETPNCLYDFYRTEILIEEYEAGNLKGKLKEVASKLKFDDNNVIAIYKLK